MRDGHVTLFLCGDVMTGRGVDQILPHPGDPRLQETYVRDARRYVELAEEANGPIPRPVEFGWPWGDALETLDTVAPDVRVINLETSITRSDGAADGKAVHYRMSPDNVGCLSLARPDACVLANNHVLDFGHAGLKETLETLSRAGLPVVGAGRNQREAKRSVPVSLADGRRVVVFSFGVESSGIPPTWAAAGDRPGIGFLPELSEATAADVADRVRLARRPGDLVVVSLHWGSNWGYGVSDRQIDFAHRLIDAGVDVVHGHSSHHPRPIEVYRERLILYGCGDLIDDYEGISGHEEYRDDLRLLFFATLDATGRLAHLRMAPLRARQLRLHQATRVDALHLCDVLDRTSRGFGVRVEPGPDAMLQLRAMSADA